MALKTAEKRIGENIYVYTQQPLDQALEFQAALLNVCGNAVASLFAGGMSAEIDGRLLSSTIASLFANLGADDKLKRLIECANKGGLAYLKANKATAPVFLSNHSDSQTHFGEFYHELPEWIVFAVQAQFGPFGESVMRLISAAVQKAKELPAATASRTI